MPTPPSTASPSSPFLMVCGNTRAMIDGATMRWVQAGAEAMVARRPVLCLPDVVLARPDDLHRSAGGLGGLERLLDEVQLEAPAEPAAQVRRVDLHLLRRDPTDPGAELLAAGLELGGCPDVHAPPVRANVRRA